MKTSVGILLLAMPGLLAAQAMVETALGAGRAATTAAPAAGVGKAISGALDNVNRMIQKGQMSAEPRPPQATRKAAVQPQPAASVAPAEPQPVEPQPTLPQAPPEEPKPAVVYEDFTGVQSGMASAEVLRRFGPPALKVTTGPGLETMYYVSKTANLDVLIQSGKVASVNKPR